MNKATLIKEIMALNEYIGFNKEENALTASCWYNGDDLTKPGWYDEFLIVFDENGAIKTQNLMTLQDRVPQTKREQIRLLVLDYIAQPESFFTSQESVYVSANIDENVNVFTNTVYLTPWDLSENGRLKMSFTVGNPNEVPDNVIMAGTYEKKAMNAVNYIQRGRNKKDNARAWGKAFKVNKDTIKANALKGE